MMNKHTPTPWEHDEHGIYTVKEGQIITVNGTFPHFVRHPITSRIREGDAKHIVDCVNQHETLKEQLKTAQDLAEEAQKLYNEQLEKNGQLREALEAIADPVNPDCKKEGARALNLDRAEFIEIAWENMALCAKQALESEV